MYVDFKAGNNDYKLRLSTRNIVGLEKTIGCNPLSIFGSGDTIPPITTMVNILWYSMQKYHHGITLEKTQDIFDEYLEDGNSMTDFIPVLIEIFKVSGLMHNDNQKEDTEEKN
jgi:hypothetical protein